MSREEARKIALLLAASLISGEVNSPGRLTDGLPDGTDISKVRLELMRIEVSLLRQLSELQDKTK